MSDKPTVFNYRDYEDAIADILEEVKAEMCDKYCKWPALYANREEFALIEERNRVWIQE